VGIVYSLIRTPPEVIEQLRGRPRPTAAFVYQDPDAYDEAHNGLVARIASALRPRDRSPVPLRQDDDEAYLDKSWHLIHYLLTGKLDRVDGPLGLIGGDLHPLANVDFGMGKPNIVSTEAVVAFAEAAQALSDDAFLYRFIPAEMPTDQLYMGDAVVDDRDGMREYSLENFHILRDIAMEATRNGEAIITYYS